MPVDLKRICHSRLSSPRVAYVVHVQPLGNILEWVRALNTRRSAARVLGLIYLKNEATYTNASANYIYFSHPLILCFDRRRVASPVYVILQESLLILASE
jgi:hypothetical protein